MGVKVCNVVAYYHGNDGERGLKWSVHLPFDDETIATLRKFVDNDDAEGFARWLKSEYPLIYGIASLRVKPCLIGTFQTLKESGILAIQATRKPDVGYGPTFPDEWIEQSIRLREKLDKPQ